MMDRMSLAEETEAGSGEYRERLLELVEQRAGADRAPAARAFAAAYVRRLAIDGTGGISPEDLAAEVVSAFEFSAARGRAHVAVRAFNPTRERDGYEPLGSVLETNSDDWPFIVDSVTAALEERGERVARVVHPIVGITREDGRVISCSPARNAVHRESVMHYDLTRRLDDAQLAELEAAVSL
jgi:glutamate dehydrogenase